MVRKLSGSPVVLQEGLLNAYSGRVEAQILDPLPEIGVDLVNPAVYALDYARIRILPVHRVLGVVGETKAVAFPQIQVFEPDQAPVRREC